MREHLAWLLRQRSARRRVERFLVVPVRRMYGVRVSANTYLVPRVMAETEDAFRSWARGRHKLVEHPLDYWLQAHDEEA